MLIDTHAHLWFDDFADDLEEVLQRAKTAGVEKIIVPGTDVESSEQAVALAKKYPGFLYAAVGVHPEETVNKEYRILNIEKIKGLITKNREQVVAIGEIGIDLYTPEVQATLPAQKELFKLQLELANELDLPVIIHTRNSFPETWEVLQSLPTMPRGQFHCFSVDEVALQTIMSAGFSTSFCANITWSKRVAKLVALVPSERLLLETDSPFMAPGTRNEPMQVQQLSTKLAELRHVTSEEIGHLTTENAKRLFHL